MKSKIMGVPFKIATVRLKRQDPVVSRIMNERTLVKKARSSCG